MAFDPYIFADLIRDEIAKVPGAKRSMTSTVILCPYHEERTPSCRIQHDPEKPQFIGRFKCFGCGVGKDLDWNDLAAKLNLRQFGSNKAESATVPFVNTKVIRERLFGEAENEYSMSKLVRLPLDPQHAMYAGLKGGQWRGYPIEFLQETGAQLAFDPQREWYYVLLRVLIHGEEKGYIRAEVEKPQNKKYPSYLNKAGTWSASHGLFPFDYAMKMMRDQGLQTIVLVEGPRDALRLLKAGIPCCSILGTQSWSEKKSKLLQFEDVEQLILLMDGDEAGKKATDMISESVRDAFRLKVIKLWEYEIPADHDEDKLDPGNMPESMVNALRKHLH